MAKRREEEVRIEVEEKKEEPNVINKTGNVNFTEA